MDFSAAADDKSCTDRLITVQLPDLIRDFRRHAVHKRECELPDFLRRNRVLDHHNILIGNFLRLSAAHLDMFCGLKIDKIMLYQHLRDLIPGERYHAVRDNTAVPGHGNIGGSRTDIHKRNIQQTEILRNRHIDRRDRLQRHVGN